MDSGAVRNVMPPEMLAEIPIVEHVGDKKGQNFYTANGEPIPNLGGKLVGMRTEEEENAWMKFQVTPVTKALGAVKSLCRAGNQVVFDGDGSYILNKATGKVTNLREKSGTCVLRVRVPKKKGEQQAQKGAAQESASSGLYAANGEKPGAMAGFPRLAVLI